MLFAALLAAGCAQTSAFKAGDEFTPKSESPRVLLMPLDIVLSELSAAGLPFPKAEWTAAAERHVAAALGDIMRERDAELVTSRDPAEGVPDKPAHTRLVKLHAAVGAAILIHQYQPMLALPTKKGKFDWTLGNGARTLGEEYGCDYALFVYLRDSYSSSGRVAVIVLGALLGAVIPGGAQVGFASLVDLETGDIVWFNRLISGTGDLRAAAPARKAVDLLLAEFPL